MPHPFLILLQSALDISRSQLRWELLILAVGVMLISFGAAALISALYFARRKTRDYTLIYFGLFSAMYGFRLLARLQMIQSNFSHPPVFWRYIDWFVTCTILVPLGLFLLNVSSPRLQRFFRWMIAAQAAFGVIGIIAALAGVNLNTLYVSNNILVLGTLVVAVVFLLWVRLTGGTERAMSREIKVSIFGFVVWMLFVVQVNITSLQIGAGRNFEFIGFLVFVCCLGYVAVSRSFTREEQLLNINKELEIARQIQASILPRDVPHLAGLEIAARYVPMSAVAGDFYDFLAVDSARVGILVADVSGHGVPAALIASMLKVAFAGQAEHAEDPARVLSGLNRALCGKFEDHFVTAAYLFVDTEKQLARYAGAGHPPLLLAQFAPAAARRVAAGGVPTDDVDGGEVRRAVRAIEENGFMLGVFPDADFSVAEIPLRPGDRCLLYTDGLFEAADAAQEEFGPVRLAQFLEARCELPAPLLADALLTEVAQWAGHAAGGQNDDITLVVIDLVR
jgi:sigma-B regulation protein RsbU (phosphoserine phosphatase)